MTRGKTHNVCLTFTFCCLIHIQIQVSYSLDYFYGFALLEYLPEESIRSDIQKIPAHK